MNEEPRRAVNVHLTGSDIPVGAPPAPNRRLVTILHTVYLTAETPVAPVFGRDLSRKAGWVQAIGNDVTLCTSKSNAAIGEGAILPHANTAPTPVEGVNELWAYASSYPAQVSVIESTWGPEEQAG